MSYCDDYEQPSFYHDIERKARKDHRCCECRGIIKQGERYHEHRGKWDGEVSTFKRCADCTHLACDLAKELYDGECGVAFGQLKYEVGEAGEHMVAAFNVVSDFRRGRLS